MKKLIVKKTQSKTTAKHSIAKKTIAKKVAKKVAKKGVTKSSRELIVTVSNGVKNIASPAVFLTNFESGEVKFGTTKSGGKIIFKQLNVGRYSIVGIDTQDISASKYAVSYLMVSSKFKKGNLTIFLGAVIGQANITIKSTIAGTGVPGKIIVLQDPQTGWEMSKISDSNGEANFSAPSSPLLKATVFNSPEQFVIQNILPNETEITISLD